jgi:hypothetical protein
MTAQIIGICGIALGALGLIWIGVWAVGRINDGDM